MSTPTIDLSDIRDHFVRPNQLVQLVFPELGLVHLRILSTDDVPYLYRDVGTIQANDTDVSSADRLGISTWDIENSLEVTKVLHMYQLFYGISPGIVRARIGYPMEALTKGIDVRANQIKGDWGYIDGFRSPLNRPSPITETIIPPKFDIGWVFHNPDTVPIKPMIYWHIVTMRIQVIRNPELVYSIMAGKLESRVMRKNMGGMLPFHFHPKDIWAVDLINTDTLDVIDVAEATNDARLRESAKQHIRDALGNEEGQPEDIPPIY